MDIDHLKAAWVAAATPSVTAGEFIGAELAPWPDPDGPWLVGLKWALIDNRVQCVHFEMFSIDKDLPVTGTVLRTVPLSTVIETALKQKTAMLEAIAASARLPDKVKDRARKRLKQIHKPRKGGRRALPLEHWEDVASAYTTAHLERKSPTKAVAEGFNISYSAAAKKVAKCRQLGLLPPTTRGKASA